METIHNFYQLNAIQPIARTFAKPLYKKNNRTLIIKSIDIADSITLERADTHPGNRPDSRRGDHQNNPKKGSKK